MSISVQRVHFTERRVDEISRGWARLSAEERAYLCSHTVTLEGYQLSTDDLHALSDQSLMCIFAAAWREQASFQSGT